MDTSLTKTRNRYGAGITPSQHRFSTVNGAGADRRFAGPLTNAQTHAAHDQKDITPRVAQLLQTCSPPHISFFVMSVYVDTIKGVVRGWLGAHVGVELLKRFEVKFDASPPIILKMCIIGIITTIFCPVITVAFRLGAYVRGRFAMTLTIRTRSHQMPCLYKMDSATRTLTPPTSSLMSSIMSSKAKYFTFAKSQARKISKGSIGGNGFKFNGRMIIGHNISLRQNIVVRLAKLLKQFCKPFDNYTTLTEVFEWD